MKELIEAKRCVIVAADVENIGDLANLVASTCDVQGIGGYKVGLVLVLQYGLPRIVDSVRHYTEKPIIYDHQKAGTDIPKLGTKFAKVVADSGVNAAILFPFAGGATEREWIDALGKADVTILVGGHMTQPEFLFSEGGFIHDEAPEKMYTIAAQKGVRDFVVPGNKLVFVKKYKELLEKLIGKGNFQLWAPGFIDQGGNITEFGKEAGDQWRAIVGSAIYEADNIRKAAETVTSQL